ncbi:hypothetical protein [Amycolatopsis sp. lyj-23]|uniref:hypothetical protein n=1 Tax=Amycolatopsis sp. lyj-23 TaxID=2789283 RepID=UPI00397B4D87
MSDDVQVDGEPVAWWRRGLIVLAVLTAAGGAALAIAGAAPDLLGGYAIFVPVPVVPLFFAGNGRYFRSACTVVGWGLFVGGVFFAVLGLIVFVPAGLVVLAAGWAERRRTVLWGTTSLVIAVLSVTGWVVADVRAFRPMDAFVVQFDRRGYAENSDTLRPLLDNPPRFGLGATDISSGSTQAGPEWSVFFRPDLSTQDKGALEGYLRGLPAVVSVALCEPPPFGCR